MPEIRHDGQPDAVGSHVTLTPASRNRLDVANRPGPAARGSDNSLVSASASRSDYPTPRSLLQTEEFVWDEDEPPAAAMEGELEAMLGAVTSTLWLGAAPPPPPAPPA
jgi:hypothetical protein